MQQLLYNSFPVCFEMEQEKMISRYKVTCVSVNTDNEVNRAAI